MVGDPLPKNWHWATLAEVQDQRGRAIVSGPFGSNIGSRFFVESGVPIIRGNNLTTDLTRFVERGFVYLTEEKASEFRNCEAVRGDLVFTAAGSLGQVGIIPDNSLYDRYIISNKQLRARVDAAKVLPIFAFYWLSSPEMVAYIQQRNTGSTVPLINLSVLRQLPVPLPPLPDQKRIADILVSLDDKIELNRKMNETLEAMARAIFKSWFVNFDPVVAKSEGRQPEGMDAETAKLFPDSFEDSEIGRIPKGWKVKPFSETVEILSGGTPKTTETSFWGGDIPWFSVVDSSSDSDVFVIKTEKTITQAGVDNSATQVLPHGTTIISARGTVGKTCIVGVPMAMNQSCFGICDRSSNKGFFTFYSTKSLVSTLQSHAHGSVFATINRNTFNGIHTIVPPQAVVHEFEETIDPLFVRIRSNLLERQTLATTRDTLLPRLLSGEISSINVPTSQGHRDSFFAEETSAPALRNG